MDRKVTLLVIARYGLVAFAVFIASRCYYQSTKIRRSTIEIIPSNPVVEYRDVLNSEQSVIRLSDTTLKNKFVGSDEVEPTTKVQKKYDKADGGRESYHSVLKSHNVPEPVTFSSNDNWAKAGEPYIVPQISDQDRQLKIKRYLAPK
ncbi:plasmid transfer protein HtdO [Photorhabdus heterorhabditis]|uniref:HtdO n=1 Tax=Photorhabdus heterorhabditis TaxID=880156 RepID=A0A5B0WIF2_9GAMM|nr:plasmid transfer protein HtdO [Photorhabdus heterorhabditis]KAA1186417.1 hypothetical protein F0L16_13875 [Photorhabdus heterorhabditis]